MNYIDFAKKCFVIRKKEHNSLSPLTIFLFLLQGIEADDYGISLSEFNEKFLTPFEGNTTTVVSKATVSVTIYFPPPNDQQRQFVNRTDPKYFGEDEVVIKIPLDPSIANSMDIHYNETSDRFWDASSKMELLCALAKIDASSDGSSTTSFLYDQCVVASIDLLKENVVSCVCPPKTFSFVQTTRRREGGRRASDESNDDYLHEISHAFLRASVVLSSPLEVGDIEKNAIVISILGAIYFFYVFVAVKAIFQDRHHRHQRHMLLLKSEFVGKAVRAMRENFVRLELSHRNR